MAVAFDLITVLRSILTLGIGFVLGRLLSGFVADVLKGETMQKLLKPRGYGELEVDLLAAMLKYFVYVLVFLVVIMQFGVGEVVVQTIAIIFILVLFLIMAYSLKEFIPNVAAGLYINRNEIFEEGDNIQIDEFKGKVIRKGVLSTIIKTEDRKVIIIPNSIVARRKVIKIPTADVQVGE
jgi:small-conductance mechanosensitive channel